MNATRLDFLPAPADAACVVCRDPGDTGSILACERCGVRFHDWCYWAAIASAAERGAWLEAPVDAPYAFVCRSCRA